MTKPIFLLWWFTNFFTLGMTKGISVWQAYDVHKKLMLTLHLCCRSRITTLSTGLKIVCPMEKSGLCLGKSFSDRGYHFSVQNWGIRVHCCSDFQGEIANYFWDILFSRINTWEIKQHLLRITVDVSPWSPKTLQDLQQLSELSVVLIKLKRIYTEPCSKRELLFSTLMHWMKVLYQFCPKLLETHSKFLFKRKSNAVSFFMLRFDLMVAPVGKPLEYKMIVYNCLLGIFSMPRVQYNSAIDQPLKPVTALSCSACGLQYGLLPAILSISLGGFNGKKQWEPLATSSRALGAPPRGLRFY